MGRILRLVSVALFASIHVASAAVVLSPRSSADGDAAATLKDAKAVIIPPECINSASAFVEAFAQCKPIPCISPCLYVNIQSGVCGNSSSSNGGYRPTLANPRRTYSFISGYDGLQKYTEYQLAPGACNSFDQVTTQMLRWVGFSDSFIKPNCNYRLAVFEGRLSGSAPGSCDIYSEKQGAIWEPTWVQLAARLRDTFDVHLNANTIRTLTLNNLDWTASTGCNTRENIYCGSKDPAMASCSKEFLEGLDTICPAYSAGNTKSCTEAFKKKYGGDGGSASPAAARALISECFGGNSYFSGWGFGWNPKMGWSSAEFLVDNLTPADLGATFVDISFGRTNRFKCVPGVNTPVRISASGNTQCLSMDGKNCGWGQSYVDCLSWATVTNPDTALTIECGEQYKQLFGSTGYEDPNGWCTRGKAGLASA